MNATALTGEANDSWFTELARALHFTPKELAERLRAIRRSDSRYQSWVRNERTLQRWEKGAKGITAKSALFVHTYLVTHHANAVQAEGPVAEISNWLVNRMGRRTASSGIPEIEASLTAFSARSNSLIARDRRGIMSRIDNYAGSYLIHRKHDGAFACELLHLAGPGESLSMLVNYSGAVFQGIAIPSANVTSCTFIAKHKIYVFGYRMLMLNTVGDGIKDLISGILIRFDDDNGAAVSSDVIMQYIGEHIDSEIIDKLRTMNYVSSDSTIFNLIGRRQYDQINPHIAQCLQEPLSAVHIYELRRRMRECED